MGTTRSPRKLSAVVAALLAGSIAIAIPALASAQTATLPASPTAVPATPESKPTPVARGKRVPAKPARNAVRAGKRAPAGKAGAPTQAVTTNGQPTNRVVNPASSQTPIAPASAAGAAAAVQGAAPGAAPGRSPVAAPRSYATGGDSRAPVAGQGLGTFLFGDWTLIAYGCFRTGTRAFCDFDATKQRAVQARANTMWIGVRLVDDGGKVTARHNAFFVGEDGSQFPTAYVSTNPVRMIMEFDNVSPNFNSVSLVQRSSRIQNVPITPADGNQPAGSIPARPGAGQPAGSRP